jgi:tripartite-type tricarboxylate transporter receptor subunit TctC
LSYASTGRGRLTHLAMELLQTRAGVKLRLVPYAGGPAEAMSDIIGDRVDLIIDGYAGLAGAMQGGLIKMLASTWSERLPTMENLPTVAETLPDYFVAGWGVLLAPANTPAPIIGKVSDDLRSALEDKELVAKFATNGAFPRYKTPEETIEYIRTQQKLWRPIVEKATREMER